MDRLDDAQRHSFERLWIRLAVDLHDIMFNLHDPGWSPKAIESLADASGDHADVFFKS